MKVHDVRHCSHSLLLATVLMSCTDSTPVDERSSSDPEPTSMGGMDGDETSTTVVGSEGSSDATGTETDPLSCTPDASTEPGVVLRAEDRIFPPELDFGFVRFAPGWGDFEAGPYGTFAIIPGATATPPHVHRGAYSGVVIRGTLINPFGTEDDPPQLGPGSFWHVPAGEQHVTACVSEEGCWGYLYADEGFDFTPIDALTDPRSDQAVTRAAETIAPEAFAPFVSFETVEGDFAEGPHGTFGVFGGGRAAPAHVHSAEYHGVAITGALINPFAGETDPPSMSPGSLWTVPSNAEHVTACESEEDCLIFIHGRGGFDVEFVCE